MTHRLTTPILALALAALGGCTVLPTYQPPAGITTAAVKLADRGKPSACIGNKPYRLEPDANNVVRLPVDERVTLWDYFTMAGYQVTWTCVPANSFIPRAGQSYTMIFEVEPERQVCTFRPYRDTTANRIGLEFEPSMRPAQSCAKP